MPDSASVRTFLRRRHRATAPDPLEITKLKITKHKRHSNPIAGSSFAFVILSIGTLLSAANLRAAELAIVIDDVGYNLSRAERILDLPVELTLGMLPYAPHTQYIAERAYRSGREIILHQPMEPIRPMTAAQREPGTLELSMNAELFERQFADSLARLPQVTGVNNHTGSLLTAHRLPMEWLMMNIAKRGLYFLDSRTTPHTVAETTARDLAVPTIHRDVFLDHVRTEQFLEAAFAQSLKIARRKGHAVIIAHPYAITLAFLEERLSRLPDDVRLTTLSDLVTPAIRPLDQTTLALLGNPASPNISLGQ